MKKGEHKDMTIPFGKFKNQLVADIETNYLKYLLGEDWFCQKFPEHAKQVKIELDYRQEWGE